MKEIKELLFEDYKTLRGEIFQTMQNRNSIINFGIASLAFLINAGFISLSNGEK